MKLICISVKDLATETYGRPFFVVHPAQALRSFTDEVNNPESEIHKHHADYELYEVGSFDDLAGAFTPSPPVRLVRASDLVKA